MRRLLSIYKAIALLAFNTLIAFIVINAFLFIAFTIYDKIKADPDFGKQCQVYPGLSADQIHLLLVETRRRPFTFAPFTHYKERPFSGDFVNVSEAGFRCCGGQSPQPWPPSRDNINIFVFGGSTTFGYGVSDAETIPAQLSWHLSQKLPRVCVYNFGCGTYASTQERILFEQLVLAGRVPDVAVFIDGINDFIFCDGLPQYSDRLKETFEGPTIGPLVSELPLARLRSAMRNRYSAIRSRQSQRTEKGKEADKQAIMEVLGRYF